MKKILISEHVPSGTRTWNGYPSGYCTAPAEKGLYTLFELADENNRHVGWHWEQETRDDTIRRMVSLMLDISGGDNPNYTWDKEREIWDLCSAWNSEHYDGRGDNGEIFMSEDEDEDGNYRVYIEDDYFYI